MKTIVSVFLYVIICSIQIYAVSAEEINLNAKAAVIMDAESGKILYEKSKDQKMPNASTTKILTCLYILKHCDLDQMAEVSKNAAMQPKVRLGVREGEKYKVKDLLYGLMLESYNDCAVVLAEHAEGSVEKFEKRMNQMAENLGTLNTHFVTPHGLDDANHYTTALELAKLTDYAMNNETFVKIVGTKSTTIYINNQSRQINNTNELLGVLNGVVGVKTGFTNNAGRCLVTETKRNNMDIITIVLGADTKKDRTKDSVNLIEYTFSKYKMYNLEEQIIKEFNKWKNINEKRILIIKGKTSNPKLALGAIEKATIPICDNDKIEYSINALTEVEAPVEQWNVMGTLTVKLNGEILENIDIVNVNEVQKRDWKDYFKIVLNRFEDMGKMLINQQI